MVNILFYWKKIFFIYNLLFKYNEKELLYILFNDFLYVFLNSTNI